MGHRSGYRSVTDENRIGRREFLKLSGGVGTALGAGMILGVPTLWAEDDEKAEKKEPPSRPKTNLDEAMKAPRKKLSLPGPFPGRVVEVRNEKAMPDGKPDAEVIGAMFLAGLAKLTGKSPEKSFPLFFSKQDVVGIKVNPVGAGLISTRTEVVDAIIAWLEKGGIPRKNIIIWDRFGNMLEEAGFTAARFPGVGVEGLQVMDEDSMVGKPGHTPFWYDKNFKHVSIPNFDEKVYYWVDADAPTDGNYLNQHVFNGKYSYFGKLLTQKVTKLINVPVLKNTGHGISVATKNLGYGAICNTGRLHRPLFFDVCAEVLAFAPIRDKLVLNVADGLRAQYEDGPMAAPKYTYLYNSLLLATDPFALDMRCHNLLVEKRKEMKIKVDEHPRYTDYLRYGERLGLGVVDPAKMKVVQA
jgi:hypothetical protein